MVFPLLPILVIIAIGPILGGPILRGPQGYHVEASEVQCGALMPDNTDVDFLGVELEQSGS